MVYDVARAVKIPVIGMGGIMTGEDAVEFLLAGASAVAVGTANFVDPYAPLKVIDGISAYLDRPRLRERGGYHRQGRMLTASPELWPGPMEGVMSPELIRAADALGLTERWMTPFLRLSTAVPGTRKLAEFAAPFLESGPAGDGSADGEPPRSDRGGRRPLHGAGSRRNQPQFRLSEPSGDFGRSGRRALRDLAGMVATVETVKKAIPVSPLSVKLRTGWESPDEMQRILPALGGNGCVSAFFLHFRTVREQYRPVSGREERFEAGLRLAAPVPVVLNGDIDSPDDASELLERTGAAGVMCARGWLRDPLLLNRIRQGRRDNSGLPSADEAGTGFSGACWNRDSRSAAQSSFPTSCGEVPTPFSSGSNSCRRPPPSPVLICEPFPEFYFIPLF